MQDNFDTVFRTFFSLFHSSGTHPLKPFVKLWKTFPFWGFKLVLSIEYYGYCRKTGIVHLAPYLGKVT